MMLCHRGSIGAASYVKLDLCNSWTCRYFRIDFRSWHWRCGWVWSWGLFLPILTAVSGLDQAAEQALATSAERRGRFVRDLPGSDALHWGDGTVMMNANKIWLGGTISSGPDYHLYLAPAFVDDGGGFLAIKAESRQIGAVTAFENFALDLPPAIDLDEYDAVVIWYEASKQFITVARLEN